MMTMNDEKTKQKAIEAVANIYGKEWTLRPHPLPFILHVSLSSVTLSSTSFPLNQLAGTQCQLYNLECLACHDFQIV